MLASLHTQSQTREARRAADIRQINASSVLRLLLDEGPLARVDLASRLALTTGALTRITAEMASRGLIVELDPVATSDAGRRRVPVDIDAAAFMAAGVHIGLELTTYGLVDLRGRLVGEPHTRRHGAIDVEGAIKEATAVTRSLINDSPDGSRVIGAGVISGGFVTRDWQVVADHSSLGWRGESLEGLAREMGPFSAFVDNAYRAHSKAETLFGAARGVKNFIEVFIGSLTGAALVIDSNVYSGRDARAPDIAHLPVAARSELPCECGRRGCLTSVAGREALAARARRRGLDVDSLADVTALARSGDKTARRLLRSRIEWLGEAVAILVDVFSPEKVVLAGAIRTLDNDVDLIRSIVDARAARPIDVHAMVVPTALGDATTANIVAAATPCLVDFYENALARSTRDGHSA